MADPSHIDYLHISEFIRSQLIWVHTVFKTGIKFWKSYFLMAMKRYEIMLLTSRIWQNPNVFHAKNMISK